MLEYGLQRSSLPTPLPFRGPYAMEGTDFTARQDLVGLPEGKDVYDKVWFEDLTMPTAKRTVTGHFHTSQRRGYSVFVWGGDTAVQGWGHKRKLWRDEIY